MVEEVKTINICEHKCDCCIGRIYSSMKETAQGWKEMEETKFTDTPLHRAAAAGNTAVAVEILNLMPALGRKLNPEGLSPLHLAIEKERTGTTRALAKFDKQLVRVKGRGGMTPLMQCAAKAGDPKYRELLAALLVACPDSVADVNNEYQTVVHVALVNRHCDAVVVLVDWLRRRDQILSVLSIRDLQGNTALHVAAQFGCVKGAEKLVDLVKLNRRNYQQQTALDVAEYYNKTEVVRVLQRKGARRNSEISPPQTTVQYVLTDITFAESISRGYYYLTQELTLEMRSAVLVVATLIVAATYEVVLQPPGGIYPPPEPGSVQAYRHQQRRLVVSDEAWRKHMAGQMVMQKAQYRYFMPANTFAFALSAVIMIFVVPGTPIFLILHLCLVFMCLSYLLALDTISYYTGISDMLYIMAAYAIFGAFIVKLLYYPIKAMLAEEDWWLRRLSVKQSNFWGKIEMRWGRRRCAAPVINIANAMKKQHRVLALK